MSKCARLFAVASAMTLPTLPALAQTASDVGPRYGYGPMWGGGWGWGWGWFPGMIFGPLMMLIIVGGTVALVVWLVRGFAHLDHGHGHSRTALDILEQRFARGEIDKTEFEEKRKLLQP
ncbi:MAG: SHOCT domain-containing protein [Alphaproteobacteria bacterium]|nr:SHOCT domain-containing protein [Alphaproteobacteria bacterium]